MDKGKRKVPIKNILYMYSYVWDRVEFDDYTFLDNYDDFNSADILSTLFLINVKSVIKRGIYREYREINEELRGIKGKIDFKSSIDKMSFENSKSFCIYDELSDNNNINRIIKSTAFRLFKTKDITDDNRQKLNNTLLYFNNVDLIELTKDAFSIRFNKNNSYTYFLIKVCELVYMCTNLSENNGSYKFIDLFDDDDKMQLIYELFVYKFYKYHFEKKQKLFKVLYQHNLNWNFKNGNKDLLPKMKLDIMLVNKDYLFIIDTKYYKEYMKTNYNKETFISGNIYQMLSYMNSINAGQITRGILLYPKPYNMDSINETYDTSVVSNGVVKKTKIQFITIDLSKDWEEIEKDLLDIINSQIK